MILDKQGRVEMTACGRKHLGYVCGLPAGHRYLHEARSVQGKLMHAWMHRPRPASR